MKNSSIAAFDLGRHHRAKIGFILLATEQTIQDDMMPLRPEGVGMHFSRVPTPDRITVENLTQIEGKLTKAAAPILPNGSLDVICYACTSGSLVLGEKQVNKELYKGNPNARSTSLISSVISALREMKLHRIAVVPPYIDAINRLEKQYLEQAGFEILNIQGLNLQKDSEMVRVTPEYLKAFALSPDHPEADAIFVSCGALRTLDVIDEIEQIAQKPVTCSNQAMLWNTLRLAGIADRLHGYGRLLREH